MQNVLNIFCRIKKNCSEKTQEIGIKFWVAGCMLLSYLLCGVDRNYADKNSTTLIKQSYDKALKLKFYITALIYAHVKWE